MNQKNCLFHVMNSSDVAPNSFVTALNDLPAQYRNVVRIAGGCGEMEPQEVAAVNEYFKTAFEGFGGILFSGGTAKYNKEDGGRNFMVTELPITLAEGNSNIKVLGSFPRTEIFRLTGSDQGQANLLFNDNNIDPEKTYLDAPDARYDELLAVQKNVNKLLDWDGDLEVYFNLMDTWRQGGAKTCIVTYNGGGVTYKEALKAIEDGHKLIVINGSGRKSDELAATYLTNEHKNVFVADIKDAQTLRAGLKWAEIL